MNTVNKPFCKSSIIHLRYTSPISRSRSATPLNSSSYILTLASAFSISIFDLTASSSVLFISSFVLKVCSTLSSASRAFSCANLLDSEEDFEWDDLDLDERLDLDLELLG